MEETEPPKRTWKECGAKTRAGTPCKGMAMHNGRCRMHGGKTPFGIASPHFKTGRYSKDFVSHLLWKFRDESPERSGKCEEITR